MPFPLHGRGALRAAAGLLFVAATACDGAPGGTAKTTPPAGQPAPGAPVSAASVQAGVEMLRRGDVKGAEPLLAPALKAAPDNPRLLEAMGSIYERTDRWRQAEESFRKALEVEPQAIGAALGLAAVCVDTGRYDEAARLLADVRRRDPGNVPARVKGALLDLRSGRYVESERAAREVLAAQPAQQEARYVLALSLEARGALKEAADEMRRVLAASPAHLGALSHLVTLETRLGHAREAARLRDLQDKALSRAHIENQVRDHRIEGVAAFNREDYPAALREFEAIAAVDPDDPQVHLHLGSTHLALGDLEGAGRELDRSLALDPRGDRAWAEKGRVLALQNRLDEAITALGKAVALNPQLAEPHYTLAGIYMARGDADRSAEEMRAFRSLQEEAPGSALEVRPGSRP